MAPSRAVEDVAEQRIPVAVVERDLGWRAHDDENPCRVEPELVEHGRVGFEARRGSTPPSRPGKAANLALAGAEDVEPLLRDRLRHDDASRGTAAERRAARARTRSRTRTRPGSRASERRAGARARHVRARCRSSGASPSAGAPEAARPWRAPCPRRWRRRAAARRSRAGCRAARRSSRSARTRGSSPLPRVRGPGAGRSGGERTAPGASSRCRSRRARADPRRSVAVPVNASAPAGHYGYLM